MKTAPREGAVLVCCMVHASGNDGPEDDQGQVSEFAAVAATNYRPRHLLGATAMDCDELVPCGSVAISKPLSSCAAYRAIGVLGERLCGQQGTVLYG